MKKIGIVIICISFSISSYALKLPAFFSDGMVFQRGIKIPVWGWAEPGESVTVSLNKQSKSTVADLKGNWKLFLDEESAGGPYTLYVKAPRHSITMDDILIGDVWLCSGQSNMEFTVSSADNGPSEIANANYPFIRQVKISNNTAESPLNDLKVFNPWLEATPANVGQFTAVGYFFAKELFEKLHVPIGLINSTWGGTNVETWTSRSAFQQSPEFSEMIKSLPNINLDSFVKQKNKVVVDNVLKFQTKVPGIKQDQWSNDNFDDSKWPQMGIPALWESRTLKDLDGVVWFRKKIIIDSSWNLSAGKLYLSMIDDNDETYLNGKLIGTTKGYNIKRVYNIPVASLKKGENVIAVRVEDTGGGGGIYGDPADVYFSMADKKIPLNSNWSYQVESIYSGTSSVDPNSYPSLLFNGMINPLLPYAIKGVLWYQGETNAGRAYQYRQAFPLMIKDWRDQWHQGNFPFYFVQLSSWNAANGNSNGSTWAELREAQQMTLSLPNTGMAVTTDIGNATDIHPKNKQDVGKRLAAIASNKLYGFNNIYSGPAYKSMKVQGNNISLMFNNIGKGLVIHNDRKLQGFEIAGNDKKFYPAIAEIKNNKVILYSSVVSDPVAVRYAWADDAPDANLFNIDGFPAIPFRTDNWKGITDTEKYTISK